MGILANCPSCGLTSAEIRCPRCNALKVVGCSGSCKACKSDCKSDSCELESADAQVVGTGASGDAEVHQGQIGAVAQAGSTPTSRAAGSCRAAGRRPDHHRNYNIEDTSLAYHSLIVASASDRAVRMGGRKCIVCQRF